MRGKRILDLFRRDPATPDFQLIVHPPKELDGAVGQKACLVAGPVDASARGAGHRVRDEPLSGAHRIFDVSACQLHASDIQLTGNTGRHRA
ncbi:Uncharacterised protein [Mycobacteroides abscessus subsp. abscessus]|nr:Uncharacterised protein [Mycobacteroides abscessus subsp. abscessus]SHW65990.1 Uncharacterised protein [Mycobacteroides abscessus subsp. abscessus]